MHTVLRPFRACRANPSWEAGCLCVCISARCFWSYRSSSTPPPPVGPTWSWGTASTRRIGARGRRPATLPAARSSNERVVWSIKHLDDLRARDERYPETKKETETTCWSSKPPRPSHPDARPNATTFVQSTERGAESEWEHEQDRVVSAHAAGASSSGFRMRCSHRVPWAAVPAVPRRARMRPSCGVSAGPGPCPLLSRRKCTVRT